MNPFKKFRIAIGLKQVEVAELLGIAQITISMWETGESLAYAISSHTDEYL